MVTGIAFAVFIMVGLIGVGHVGTVVQIVLMAVFIDVLIVVTGVPYAVRVRVQLQERCQRFVNQIKINFYSRP